MLFSWTFWFLSAGFIAPGCLTPIFKVRHRPSAAGTSCCTSLSSTSSPSDLDMRVSWSPHVDHISRMVLYIRSLSSFSLSLFPATCAHRWLLWSLWAIATPCSGSGTQSLAMPVGAHLQSMFTLVPLRACCLLSRLSVVPFLIPFP